MQNERNNNWLAGVVLIFIGLIFLVQSLTGISFGNWWAIFILIPAIWSFFKAWDLYKQDGSITRRVGNTLYGGMFPLLIAMIFLFNWDWGKLWPVFLIVTGLGILLSWNTQQDKNKPSPQDEQYQRKGG